MVASAASRAQRSHDRRRGPRVEHELGAPRASVDHEEPAAHEDVGDGVVDLRRARL